MSHGEIFAESELGVFRSADSSDRACMPSIIAGLGLTVTAHVINDPIA